MQIPGAFRWRYIGSIDIQKRSIFLPTRRYASVGISRCRVSVCLSYLVLLFSEEGRLAWMYKDKVDNEEYLLGRRIDSSDLNDPEPTTNG